MPERSFGRTVRYRRTKMGLSQAKLGELVGRSPSTIRSWERDNTRPTDPKTIAALAAILAVDERQLFEKAGVERPAEEDSPTVEQALATLTPIKPKPVEKPETQRETQRPEPAEPRPTPSVPTPSPAPAYLAPSDPYILTQVTPAVADPSYMEDRTQRQFYRVRTLATMVAAVALIVAFIWAWAEGWDAMSTWWDDFFGNLRL